MINRRSILNCILLISFFESLTIKAEETTDKNYKPSGIQCFIAAYDRDLIKLKAAANGDDNDPEIILIKKRMLKFYSQESRDRGSMTSLAMLFPEYVQECNPEYNPE